MLIKFVKPDPRAGDVVRLDSHRAQQFIDEGRAEQEPENESAASPEPAAPAPAPAAKAPASRKTPAAKK